MSEDHEKENHHLCFDDSRAIMIEMNETRAVIKTVLGTEGLGGCSAIAVGGNQIGILSYFNPTSRALETRWKHFVNLYKGAVTERKFPGVPLSWVAVSYIGGYHDDGRLETIETPLVSLGLNLVVVCYDGADRRESHSQGS